MNPMLSPPQANRREGSGGQIARGIALLAIIAVFTAATLKSLHSAPPGGTPPPKQPSVAHDKAAPPPAAPPKTLRANLSSAQRRRALQLQGEEKALTAELRAADTALRAAEEDRNNLSGVLSETEESIKRGKAAGTRDTAFKQLEDDYRRSKPLLEQAIKVCKTRKAARDHFSNRLQTVQKEISPMKPDNAPQKKRRPSRAWSKASFFFW